MRPSGQLLVVVIANKIQTATLFNKKTYIVSCCTVATKLESIHRNPVLHHAVKLLSNTDTPFYIDIF